MKMESQALAVLQNSEVAVSEVQDMVKSHGFAVTRRAYGPEPIRDLRASVKEILRATDGGWRPLEKGSPDFHWVNRNSPQSTVKGAFAQVNFFPWNEAGRRVIGLLSSIFHIRNRMLGYPDDSFMAERQDGEFTARVAAQFYPSGWGWMQEHRDPQGVHQEVLATLVLSRMGVDYQSGGLYIRNEDGERSFVEHSAQVGDIIWMNPQSSHGVAAIDCVDEKPGPVDDGELARQSGRWMMLCTTSGFASSANQPRAAVV